jgi:hypothetical protein
LNNLVNRVRSRTAARHPVEPGDQVGGLGLDVSRECEIAVAAGGHRVDQPVRCRQSLNRRRREILHDGHGTVEVEVGGPSDAAGVNAGRRRRAARSPARRRAGEDDRVVVA